MSHTKHAQLNAELNRTGLVAQKDNLVSGATKGRTTSRADLTEVEARNLIAWLRQQPPRPEVAARLESERRMKNKIIGLAKDMGWTLPGRRIDMNRLNAWCTNHGHGRKALDAHTHEELPKLVSQMELVYKKFLKDV